MIDAHCHVASSDTTRYPLGPTGVGTDWWTSSADVESLLARMDETGVERAVIVQAVGAYGYDCAYAIDAAASAPDRLALVGVVDFEEEEPALIGTAVRVFGVGSGLTSPTPAWLLDGRAARLWERCADAGIGVVATILEPHLPSLVPLLEAWPTVPVALDHCAFADPPALVPFAALPNVHLKISTHVLSHTDDAAGLVRELADHFGAHRMSWGSDFPQSPGDYGALVDLGGVSASALDAREREAYLHETAARLWFGASADAVAS